jgi:hypothetical protein
MTSKGLSQHLALAGILATGFAAVWGLVSLWGTLCFGAHVAGGDRPVESLRFLPDGTPRVVRTEEGNCQYRDLEGNPVPPPENGNAGLLFGATLPAALPNRATDGDTPWRQRIRSFADGGSPAVYWYFLSDGRPDGTGYFVGYNSKSRACVGYLGTAGFRTGPLPPEERIPFAGATWGKNMRVLCAQGFGPTDHPREDFSPRAPRGSVSRWDVYVFGPEGKVYHADLQHRTLNVVMDEPRLRSVALCPGLTNLVHGTPYRLAARTEDAVLVLDDRGQLVARYPIPVPLRGRAFTFAQTTAGEALMYWNSPDDSLATQVEYRIYWVASEGRYREASASLFTWWTTEGRALPLLGGVVVPAPLVLGGIVATVRPRLLLTEELATTYPEALRRALTEYSPAIMIALLLGTGLAVLCYRREVRYGASGPARVAWPLFVLALGLPGWVAYRFGRSWPVLQSCPACGTDVPADRGDCTRCATEFPGPVLTGTEVFA